jgi:hypothetical protein
MRQKSVPEKELATQVVKNIRRATLQVREGRAATGRAGRVRAIPPPGLASLRLCNKKHESASSRRKPDRRMSDIKE